MLTQPALFTPGTLVRLDDADKNVPESYFTAAANTFRCCKGSICAYHFLSGKPLNSEFVASVRNFCDYGLEAVGWHSQEKTEHAFMCLSMCISIAAQKGILPLEAFPCNLSALK
ncbi:hypothetical protein HGA64_02185 [Candidatus Falkowbacteria bacterium]|nr:hypothetical protein [Candidatus Falkowbacteria bacterium]